MWYGVYGVGVEWKELKLSVTWTTLVKKQTVARATLTTRKSFWSTEGAEDESISLGSGGDTPFKRVFDTGFPRAAPPTPPDTPATTAGGSPAPSWLILGLTGPL